ncbi:MAG: phosphoenolpyruvate--protein phosphotransferase [Planctomycetota bacterium]
MTELKHSITLKGIPVSEGIVIQKAFVLKGIDDEEFLNLKREISDAEVEEEIKRLTDAFQKSDQDLSQLEKQLSSTYTKESTMILTAHQMMLQEFYGAIEKKIREDRCSAEYAVISEIRAAKEQLTKQSKPKEDFRYTGDFQDLERRLLMHLQGKKSPFVKEMEEEVILIAEDLTPEQTLSLDLSKVKAIATDFGGPTSHTAIVAKTHKIPAVIGLKVITQEAHTGDIVVLDGKEGNVIIHPGKKTRNRYIRKQSEEQREEEDLLLFSHLPVETLDGQKISLFANIESPEEIPLALERGGCGIGLYRTEFLFNEGIPTEQTHFDAYWKALKYLKDKPLTIRTLDMGGDKFINESGAHREANPFLGCRSIRLCLRERPNLFLDQLRAVLRISAESAQVRLMFPMISSISELDEVLAHLESIKEEFRERQVPFNEHLKVGIMVEIPSAAIMADNLAKMVDFFSIGTNDLIQYTLAVDRNNERVAHLYNPVHPAILRLIKNVIRSAHQHHIEVSMCGEMPSDTSYALLLLGMGLQNISISSASIPKIVKAIRQVRLRELMEISNTVLRFERSQQIQEFLKENYQKIHLESSI